MHSRSKSGSGKNKGGGGKDLITKTKEMETKAIEHTIVTLRKAVYNDDGTDRDLTENMKPFMAFKKNGVDLEISFSCKLTKKEAEQCFDTVKENMEDKYDASGYGWDDEDKMKELREDGARFLLVREWPEEDGVEKGNLVGFAHFRISVTGDFMDEMTGESCLILWDIHLDEEYREKGIGKHLMMMLELMARKHSIDHVVVPVQLEDEDCQGWIEKLKGYKAATGLMSQINFDPEMEGFQVYGKEIVPPRPRVTAPVAAPAGPLADISNAAPTASAENATTSAEKPAPTATVFSADSAKEASLDEAVDKLKALYLEKNGKAATDGEILQWKTVLAESDEIVPTEGEAPTA